MNEAFRRARARLNQVVWRFVLFLGTSFAALERLLPGRGRRAALRAVTLLLPTLIRVLGIKIEVIGATPPKSERCVYVCNHATEFDYLVLLAALGDVKFVADEKLFDVPKLGPGLRILGAVPVDASNPRTSIAALTTLARGGLDQSVVVFPEGKKWQGPRFLPFQTGAFFLAIEAGAPVVPVVIERQAPTLRSHPARRPRRPARLPWVPSEDLPGRVVLRVLEPINTAGLTKADRRTLGDRARRSMERALASGDQGRPRSRVHGVYGARLAT